MSGNCISLMYMDNFRSLIFPESERFHLKRIKIVYIELVLVQNVVQKAIGRFYSHEITVDNIQQIIKNEISKIDQKYCNIVATISYDSIDETLKDLYGIFHDKYSIFWDFSSKISELKPIFMDSCKFYDLLDTFKNLEKGSKQILIGFENFLKSRMPSFVSKPIKIPECNRNSEIAKRIKLYMEQND